MEEKPRLPNEFFGDSDSDGDDEPTASNVDDMDEGEDEDGGGGGDGDGDVEAEEADANGNDTGGGTKNGGDEIPKETASYRSAMKAIQHLQAQIDASKDDNTIRALKAAIAGIRRSLKKKAPSSPRKLRSILYLVAPTFNGKIIGFGKFGYIRIPWDSLDWVAHIRKNCAERYGTPYKDVFVLM